MAHLPVNQRIQLIHLLLQNNHNRRQRELQLLQYLLQQRPVRRPRREWAKQWLLDRPLYGQYEILLTQLSMNDPASFRNFTRVPVEMFNRLLTRVEDAITGRPSHFRQPLPAGLKLACTLRYLASGDSYHSLSFNFRVSVPAISKFIPLVCQAIIDILADEVIDTPVTEAAWREVEELFRRRWNLPHALGALDGKHVRIKKPAGGGSLYYNYKGFHSIILLALVDADYRFRWIDIGANGCASDCQVFNHSDLRRCIEDGSIDYPPDEPLPNDDEDMPYFIVGDDAFPLREWLMKPFPGRILTHDEKVFNYRISRARRVVENAFGIMANRFRCLHHAMEQKVATVHKIVNTCVVLHNFARIHFPGAGANQLDRPLGDGNLARGAWRNAFNWADVRNIRGGNIDAVAAKQQRETLKRYFASPAGRVPWQDRMVV